METEEERQIRWKERIEMMKKETVIRNIYGDGHGLIQVRLREMFRRHQQCQQRRKQRPGSDGASKRQPEGLGDG